MGSVARSASGIGILDRARPGGCRTAHTPLSCSRNAARPSDRSRSARLALVGRKVPAGIVAQRRLPPVRRRPAQLRRGLPHGHHSDCWAKSDPMATGMLVIMGSKLSAAASRSSCSRARHDDQKRSTPPTLERDVLVTPAGILFTVSNCYSASADRGANVEVNSSSGSHRPTSPMRRHAFPSFDSGERP